MYVEVWFERSNQPVCLENVKATYQKGDMFCVSYATADLGKDVQAVVKYPVDHIFCVHEADYPSSQPDRRD